MELQQKYINILYNFQCCLANLGLELDKMESIGEDEKCINRLSNKINILILILRTLKRQVILQDDETEKAFCKTNCLSIEQVKTLLNKLKEECKECCMDYSFLDNCVNI